MKQDFGRPAHLTVSGQLNGRSLCNAFRNIYTFGPTFRAKILILLDMLQSFQMIEPEIAF